ncbi:hypothetical protein [Xylella fastidiosa]|uniref:hypothetical protein n=1 Tax=Xylella fastidiosa TaxID=2371 RepID=UPI0000459691|nr:hypothetical protein XYFPCFBP8417_01750 [Xylella fastidiosa subsp. multiplex]
MNFVRRQVSACFNKLNSASNLAFSSREPTAAVVAEGGRLVVSAESENAFNVVITANGSAAFRVLDDGRFTRLGAERFPQFMVLVCGSRCDVSIGADLCGSIRAHYAALAIVMAVGQGFEPWKGLPPC